MKKIKINDLDSFFLNDVLEKVKLRKKEAKKKKDLDKNKNKF